MKKYFIMASVIFVAAICIVLFGAKPRVNNNKIENAPQKKDVERPKNKLYCRPTVIDPNLTNLVNRNSKNRVPKDISSRIPEVKNQSDLPALIQVLTDPEDDDMVRNEVANLLRRSRVQDLPNILMKILDNPVEKAVFRTYAMQHLGLIIHEQENSDLKQILVAKMHEALADKDFQVRAQALQNLSRLKDPVGVETAVQWLTYKSADDFERGYILNQSIRCVGDLDLKEHLPTIRKYARDPNNTVRIAAIVVLSNWNDVESLPAMQEAAEAKDPLVKKCGQEALKRMQPK